MTHEKKAKGKIYPPCHPCKQATPELALLIEKYLIYIYCSNTGKN